MGCAYADGSMTLEEAILVSYLRGLVSQETKMIKGKMAAIGLGHNKVKFKKFQRSLYLLRPSSVTRAHKK